MKTNQLYQPLSTAHEICLKKNIAFASYRLPKEAGISTLIQHTSTPIRINSLDILEKKTGFIVAPFTESEHNKPYLLEPTISFQDGTITDIILEELNKNSSLENDVAQKNKNTNTTKTQFTEQVEKVKKEIANGNCSKIVLSKIQLNKISADFNPSTLFIELCQLYPQAFVSFIQLPSVGCWIGASPEPLLDIANGEIKTVSLAGTKKATDNISAIEWGAKEKEEQAIVTSYIEEIIQSFKIDNYKLKGPYNAQAGNLVHLKTDFNFPEALIKGKIADFIKAIHPTPSVCGLPKNEALQSILNKEIHERSYYAGYLGPVNIANETHLFVNLRCLQIHKKQAILYSGAGITAASDAEKEWNETEQKLLTLLNVINKK